MPCLTSSNCWCTVKNSMQMRLQHLYVSTVGSTRLGNYVYCDAVVLRTLCARHHECQHPGTFNDNKASVSPMRVILCSSPVDWRPLLQQSREYPGAPLAGPALLAPLPRSAAGSPRPQLAGPPVCLLAAAACCWHHSDLQRLPPPW